jgi:4-amino-4-deoxy-L-arabinose transferase-like glycosyltransferase
MTEVPTLLGMVVIAYLLFRWLRTERPQYALASGAAIGAASLIRANPLVLLPLAGILAALVLRRQRRLMYGQILAFSAGFIVVFSPWL